mmetsp:Transcript_2782/g.7854  ORF Transcript_2782/g.7854 Transcript_2782/m.7854 type:complete len:585 (-) Transcript_2782:838-2592(-)
MAQGSSRALAGGRARHYRDDREEDGQLPHRLCAAAGHVRRFVRVRPPGAGHPAVAASVLHAGACRGLLVPADVGVARHARRRGRAVRLRADADAVREAAGAGLARLRGRPDVRPRLRVHPPRGRAAGALHAEPGEGRSARRGLHTAERRRSRLRGVEPRSTSRHVFEDEGLQQRRLDPAGALLRRRGPLQDSARRPLAAGEARPRPRLLRAAEGLPGDAPAHPPRPSSRAPVPVFRRLREGGHGLRHASVALRARLLLPRLPRGAGRRHLGGGVHRRHHDGHQRHDDARRLHHDVLRALHRRGLGHRGTVFKLLCCHLVRPQGRSGGRHLSQGAAGDLHRELLVAAECSAGVRDRGRTDDRRRAAHEVPHGALPRRLRLVVEEPGGALHPGGAALAARGHEQRELHRHGAADGTIAKVLARRWEGQWAETVVAAGVRQAAARGGEEEGGSRLRVGALRLLLHGHPHGPRALLQHRRRGRGAEARGADGLPGDGVPRARRGDREAARARLRAHDLGRLRGGGVPAEQRWPGYRHWPGPFAPEQDARQTVQIRHLAARLHVGRGVLRAVRVAGHLHCPPGGRGHLH